MPRSFIPVPYEDRYRRGVELFEQGQFEEASRLFGESLKNRETGDRWTDWATARLACEHLDEAERGFLRALWMEPNHGVAAAKLGILLASQGRTHEAIGYLERGASSVNGPERDAILELLDDCRAKLSQPVELPISG